MVATPFYILPSHPSPAGSGKGGGCHHDGRLPSSSSDTAVHGRYSNQTGPGNHTRENPLQMSRDVSASLRARAADFHDGSDEISDTTGLDPASVAAITVSAVVGFLLILFGVYLSYRVSRGRIHALGYRFRFWVERGSGGAARGGSSDAEAQMGPSNLPTTSIKLANIPNPPIQSRRLDPLNQHPTGTATIADVPRVSWPKPSSLSSAATNAPGTSQTSAPDSDQQRKKQPYSMWPPPSPTSSLRSVSLESEPSIPQGDDDHRVRTRERDPSWNPPRRSLGFELQALGYDDENPQFTPISNASFSPAMKTKFASVSSPIEDEGDEANANLPLPEINFHSYFSAQQPNLSLLPVDLPPRSPQQPSSRRGVSEVLKFSVSKLKVPRSGDSVDKKVLEGSHKDTETATTLSKAELLDRKIWGGGDLDLQNQVIARWHAKVKIARDNAWENHIKAVELGKKREGGS